MRLILILSAASLMAADVHPAFSGLTVHEWGTFTSVAGEDGSAMNWLALGGAADLPCFVSRFGNWGIKATLSGTVRMETPVLYFYSPHETSVNVKVGFPHGLITEWYPHARVGPAGPVHSVDGSSDIAWDNVRVSPEATPKYPSGAGASHYYAARETDAAPLAVGDDREKFLFYRGVGVFQPGLSARVTADNKIEIRNFNADQIPAAILFENRGGKLGYRAAGSIGDRMMLDPPSLTADFAALRQELESTLIAQGLYKKEAQAMIATWRDSWFEEGARVLYIVPARAVDAFLPLEMNPAPAQISRVFVGRMELITSATETAVEQAIASNDRATLDKYGRFLEPIVTRLLNGNTFPADRSRLERFLGTVYSTYSKRDSGCK